MTSINITLTSIILLLIFAITSIILLLIYYTFFFFFFTDAGTVGRLTAGPGFKPKVGRFRSFLCCFHVIYVHLRLLSAWASSDIQKHAGTFKYTANRMNFIAVKLYQEGHPS